MLVACGWLYEKDLAYDESSLRVQQTEYITHYFYSSISIPRVVLTKTDGSETRSRTATAGSEYLRTNKHTSVRKFTRFSAVRHFLNTWTQWRAAAGLYSSWHHNDLHCLKVHGEETEPKTMRGSRVTCSEFNYLCSEFCGSEWRREHHEHDRANTLGKQKKKKRNIKQQRGVTRVAGFMLHVHWNNRLKLACDVFNLRRLVSCCYRM